MIDVYSTKSLVDRGKINSYERFSSYFHTYFRPENRVLIFPTLAEANEFGKGFGNYILQNEGIVAFYGHKVIKTHPDSDIEEPLTDIVTGQKKSGETWLVFNPDTFSKLEEYMASRNIEYRLKE